MEKVKIIEKNEWRIAAKIITDFICDAVVSLGMFVILVIVLKIILWGITYSGLGEDIAMKAFSNVVGYISAIAAMIFVIFLIIRRIWRYYKLLRRIK